MKQQMDELLRQLIERQHALCAAEMAEDGANDARRRAQQTVGQRLGDDARIGRPTHVSFDMQREKKSRTLRTWKHCLYKCERAETPIAWTWITFGTSLTQNFM